MLILLAPSAKRKIILTPDQFSKITKLHKQKQANLVIPTVPIVPSTSEINTRLSMSTVEIDTTRSRYSPTNLQYNQVKY